MEEWKEYKLGDITDLVIDYRGKTPLKLGSDWSDSGYRALSAKNIKTGQIVAHDSIRYVDEVLYHKWMKDEVNRGDILITSEAPFGQVFYWDSDEKIVLSQRLFCVRIKQEIDSRFVYYYMTTSRFQSEMSSRASGTTVLGLRQPELLKCRISVPSLDTQRQIASILSSLDDKIAVNKKICENLEAQAQALFKHWFIDFAPFKDGKFVESELGLIPEELIYKRIEDMPHTLETGKRPSGGVKGIDHGIPSIGAENIKGLGCYDFSKTKYVTEEFASSMKKGIINGYELLIYKDGGKPGYFIPNFAIFGEGYPYDKMCLNEHVFKLDFGNKGYSLFAYFYFKTKQIMSYLNAQGAKAAIPGINSKDIDAIMMPSLDNECVKQYCSEVEDIITQILVLSKESAKLATLRDTLLPKLMSGQIKLNEYE